MRTIVKEIKGGDFDRYCYQIGDGVGDFLVDWFHQWFELSVQNGIEIASGGQILYGWNFLKCDISDRQLTLSAPDFQTLPLQWTKDLSVPLHCAVFHRYVPESYDLQMDIPSLAETLVVGADFEKLPMFMVRSSKADENSYDSGWFLGSLAENAGVSDPSSMRLMTLYEAVLKAPRILKYLSLPKETQVVFVSEKPMVLYQGKELSPKAGSFMEAELSQLL
jgi:hypothetical protein